MFHIETWQVPFQEFEIKPISNQEELTILYNPIQYQERGWPSGILLLHERRKQKGPRSDYAA
jgi:hypothetical protein